MAKFSTRFSRYFIRRSRTSAQYSIDLKSKISRPLPLEEDTLPLTTSNLPCSVSDNEVVEEQSTDWQSRDLDSDIDDILAQYQYTPTNAVMQTPIEAASPTTTFKSSSFALQKIKSLPYTPPPAPSYKKLVFGMEVWRCSPNESMLYHSSDTRGHSAEMGAEPGWGGVSRSCNVNYHDGNHFSKTNTERMHGDYSANSDVRTEYRTRRREKQVEY